MVVEFLKENSLTYRESDNDFQLCCPLCSDRTFRLGIKKQISEDKKEDHFWKCFNCFTEDTIIYGDGTAKKISQVVEGDNVITKEGSLRRVEKVHRNGIRNDLLKISASWRNGFECTPEHKIFVVRAENVIYGRQAYQNNNGKIVFGKIEEILASELMVGDWLVSPKIDRGVELENLKIDLKPFTRKLGRKPKETELNLEMDEDLGFIFGLYLAEGSFNRGINYSLNKGETHVIEKLFRIFMEKFGIEGKSYEQGEQNQNKSAWFGFSQLGRWFEANLGHGAANKKIPQFVFYANKNFRAGVLKGIYVGDGSKGRASTDICTISEQLAYQTKLLAQTLGLFSGVSRKQPIKNEYANSRQPYYLVMIQKNFKSKTVGAHFDGDSFYYRVKSIGASDYNGAVYDLTVADSHTYLANGLSVHNCNASGKKIGTLAKAMGVLKKLNRKQFVEYRDEEKVTIESTLGAELFKRLSKTPEAVKYLLHERCLSKETIKHFKLGYREVFVNAKTEEDYEAGPHIAIPYYEGSTVVNIKYRNIDPTVEKSFKWRREKGGKTALFNSNVLNNHEFDEVIIAESEIDTMSIYDAGFECCVGLTAGASSFKQEWYDKLERFDKIYIVLDNDKAGQDGSKKLAKRLGLNRCYNIVLPETVKDPNDYFKKYDKEDFKKLLSSAEQFPVENVSNLSIALDAYLEELENGDSVEDSIDTGWDKVNKVLGVVRSGNLVVVAARPKVGKTTMVLNWLLYLAKKGITSFNLQVEMSDRDLLEKYVMMDSNVLMPRPEMFQKGSIDYINAIKEKVSLMKSKVIDLPRTKLFSYHPTIADLELDSIVSKVTESVQRFGAEVVVIDNLLFLCRGENEREMVDKATQTFKSLATSLGVVLILVTHPRKTNNNKALTNDDLKSSSSIFQDADVICLMHREYTDLDKMSLDEDEEEDEDEGVMSNLTEIKVTARRGKGGRAWLYFSDEFSKFKDNGPSFTAAMDERRGKGKKKKSTSDDL